jgi:predicted transcriptional regulator of viral defense system
MIPIEEIKKIFNQHGDVMRTKDLVAAKIYYADIQKLLNADFIEKIKRGYYHLVDSKNVSEANIINHLFPEAILCLDTALFYYGYSDRTPSVWHLAVDKDIQKSRFKIDYPFIKPYFWESNIVAIGITEGEIDNNKVRIYDKDRTICDCLRYMGKMDKEVFNKAIQNYIRDEKKSITNLLDYAKKLRVHKKVKDLIGVWL